MHTYSTDNDLRPKIVGFIGIVSYVIVQVLVNVVSILNATLPYGIHVSVPATGAVFTSVYFLFGSFLWNHWIFRQLQIVKTPNLTGEWDGTIQSSYNSDSGSRTDIEVHIKQSWRKIRVELIAPNSVSQSLGATIMTQQGKPQLIYQYRSEPNYGAPESMSIHYGTTSLTFHEGSGEGGEHMLEGIYYTSPDRESHGKIKLKQVG